MIRIETSKLRLALLYATVDSKIKLEGGHVGGSEELVRLSN